MENKCLAEIRFSSNAEELGSLRKEVKEVLEKHKYNHDTISNVVLGVNEACMNIIQHAYGENHTGDIVLEILEVQGDLVFRLTDFAEPVDKSCIKSRDLNDIRPGGLGVHIINEVMDQTEFLEPPDGVGNVLEMKKNIKSS